MRGLVLFAAALQIALVKGCSDTSTDCAYYKEAGYCESYGDTLKEMCAKTCGFCGGSGGGDGGDPVLLSTHDQVWVWKIRNVW